MRQQTVTQARETIDRRVNELGVTEPNISEYGNSGDQLLVQLPGVSDTARAKEIIRSTAQLQLKIVEAGPMSSEEALLQQYKGKMPDDMEVVSGAACGDEAGPRSIGGKTAAVTGQACARQPPSRDGGAVGFS